MSDFNFVQKRLSKKWSIIVPRRSSRPDAAKGSVSTTCPFCPGVEDVEIERVGARGTTSTTGNYSTDNSDEVVSEARDTSAKEWLVRVIPNKFPFALHHELIIHSPDHHKNIDELPLSQVVRIFELYQRRYKVHQNQGSVVIFHNRGEKAGESIPHPHTQLAVLPHKVAIETSQLRDLYILPHKNGTKIEHISTEYFEVFCPAVSDWPDEVVIAPKRRKTRFSSATSQELADAAMTLQNVLKTLTLRHKEEFPFNFYIYPLYDWYIRIVPREKVIGGFEVATNIQVVTKDPAETMSFLRENLGSY